MAAGDTISGTGGDVVLTGGASLLNVKKWTLTRTRNVKKYAVAGLAHKRAVAGTIESTGTMEVEIEEGQRSAELLITGARVQVDFEYDGSNKLAGWIVVNNTTEGVNMDDGQIDTLVVAFDVDGELTATGAIAGGSA
jgi:hypothetical protein